MPQTATAFDPTKFGASLISGTANKKPATAPASPATSTFDPSQFGATPFDPAQLGATPVESTSLLDSRRAASKSEFDANQPDYTKPEHANPLTAPLDFAIGLEHTLGLDPMHPVTSAPGAVYRAGKGLIDLGVGGPMKQIEMVKGMGEAAADSLHRGGESIRNQNLPEAAQAAGELYGMAKPALEAGKAGLEGGIDTVRSLPSTAAISKRITTSLIRPSEASFDFGADPVEVAQSLPIAKTMSQYSSNVKAALKEQEATLQSAIDSRRAAFNEVATHASDVGNGIDVAPMVRAAFEDMAAQAESTSNPGLARRLRKTGDIQLQQLAKRNGGSTYLTPEQILAEKRTLRDSVQFKSSETTQMTMNEAFANMYRGLDHGLDTLVPEAAEINRRYAGLVQLDKLVEHDLHIRGNQPLLTKGGGMYSAVARSLPEAFPKSVAIRALNAGKEFPGTKLGPGVTHEFMPRPIKGPYESGYQPEGETRVGPRSDTVEGGVHRPGESAPPAPRNVVATDTPEGGVHRPGTPAPYTPRPGGEIAEDGSVVTDPYTGKVRGYSNPNLPVRVQGRPMGVGATAEDRGPSTINVETGAPTARDVGGGISSSAKGKSVQLGPNKVTETTVNPEAYTSGQGKAVQLGPNKVMDALINPEAYSSGHSESVKLGPYKTTAPSVNPEAYPSGGGKSVQLGPNKVAETPTNPEAYPTGQGGGKSVRLGNIKLTFLGSIPDPLTGKPARWVYQDPTGQRIELTTEIR